MIDLYTWPTPNGHKIHVMLEECGFAWQAHAVNIGAGEQFDKDFLKISPNNKIPAMVDNEGINGKPVSLFESGAILLYLAEKSGRFMPVYGSDAYFTCLQWLMFQMGGVGPMFGQAHHFILFADVEIPYAINRYSMESQRLCRVMDKRLGESAYLAGDDYSIADIATYPWVRFPEKKGIDFDEFLHLRRWFTDIESRAAVQRGIAVLSENQRGGSFRGGSFTEEEKDNMFGTQQYQKR